MLLQGRLLLPPTAGFRGVAPWQQPAAASRTALTASQGILSSTRRVVLHARRKTTESEGPEPAAKASRKGRRRRSEEATEADAEPAAADAGGVESGAAAEAGLTTWLDASGSPEEDRRRFPYHRRLQNAASEGQTDAAEAAFTGMEAAGLSPGPRAFHVLLCAYLKAGDTPGALGVVGRATEAGVQLLPESYAVLIYTAMEASPPDVEVATTLYGALAGTDTGAQLPWSTLVRLLSAKGFASEAVAAVKEGLRSGLVVDADVAEAYMKALCDTQELDAALTFLEMMAPKYGLRPEARHVTYLVGAYAAAGEFDDASSLIDAAGNRNWGRNAATFNALMAGIVKQLGGETPDEALTFSFSKMTGRMVQSGVRPNKFTFRLEAEGHVRLGDARSAMGAIKSLRTAAGTAGLRLLDPSALSGLLQLLSDRDMPVDMLQLLVYMAEDGCRMPAGALSPDPEGRSPLDAWLSSHLEGLSARSDLRSAEANMLNAPIEYVNGVPLGPGLCVVDEDGVIVPVAKCTVKELRAEAEGRQLLGAKDMKRPELAAAIKAARARLPFNVLQAQVKSSEGGVKGGSKQKKAAAALPKTRQRKGRGPAREVWMLDSFGGVDIRAAPPDSEFRTEAEKFLLSESALDDIDLTDDQYALASNKNNKDIDFDALLEARMLDEGTAAVMNVGDEDVMSGFATLLPGAEADEDDEEGAADDDDESKAGGGLDEEAWRKMQSFEARSIDPQTLQEGYRQLQFLESQQIDTDEANLVAGMDIAMDIVRAAETVGGAVTPADLLLLTSGALAERNVNAAADIARRLSLLLAPAAALPDGRQQVPQQYQGRYDPAYVLQQYESLADMCIAARAVQQADVVLEAAEVAGLQPSRGILERLTAALRGQPRRSERLGRENAALLERAGVDDLGDLTTSDINLPATTQDQQQQLPAAAAAAAAPDVPTTEIAVEALSATDRPVGDQQQQQQQQAAAGEGEGDAELPEYLRSTADVLEGMQEWQQKQAHVRAVLQKTGMFDEDDINDMLTQPAALMADLSWVPATLMAAVNEGGDEEQQEGGATRGQQRDGGDDDFDDGLTMMELVKACVHNRLTPDQLENLLESAEAAGLPLLLDEVDQRILWPGSSDYQAWADESPQEAKEDAEFIAAALREEFGDLLAEAEEAAAGVTEDGVTADQLDADSPDMLDALSLKEQYHEALQEMGLLPRDGEAQQAATAAAAEGVDPAASEAEQERLMQQLHEQLEQMIADRADVLRSAFKQLDLPEPDLSLDGSGDDGSSDGGSSSSRQRKQLTGR